MNVLVTGAAGQVGQALIATAPATLNVIARTRAELDISNASAVASCIQRHNIDVIINAAAYTAVDRAEDEPESAQRANADAPLVLAKAARDSRARLLHISTDFVFDGAGSVPYSPEAPTNPLNVYGKTKRDGELSILRVYPAGSVIVRTSWGLWIERAQFCTDDAAPVERERERHGSCRVGSNRHADMDQILGGSAVANRG